MRPPSDNKKIHKIINTKTIITPILSILQLSQLIPWVSSMGWVGRVGGYRVCLCCVLLCLVLCCFCFMLCVFVVFCMLCCRFVVYQLFFCCCVFITYVCLFLVAFFDYIRVVIMVVRCLWSELFLVLFVAHCSSCLSADSQLPVVLHMHLDRVEGWPIAPDEWMNEYKTSKQKLHKQTTKHINKNNKITTHTIITIKNYKT